MSWETEFVQKQIGACGVSCVSAQFSDTKSTDAWGCNCANGIMKKSQEWQTRYKHRRFSQSGIAGVLGKNFPELRKE